MKKIPIRQISSAYQEVQTSERFAIRQVQDIVGGKDLIHDLHRHDFFFILGKQSIVLSVTVCKKERLRI